MISFNGHFNIKNQRHVLNVSKTDQSGEIATLVFKTWEENLEKSSLNIIKIRDEII